MRSQSISSFALVQEVNFDLVFQLFRQFFDLVICILVFEAGQELLVRVILIFEKKLTDFLIIKRSAVV